MQYLADKLMKLKIGLLTDLEGAEADKNTFSNHSGKLTSLALVAKTTTNSVIITDANNKIVWVNPAFIIYTGYTEEFVLGKTPGSFLQSPDTSVDTINIMRSAISRHVDFNVEVLNFKKSGESYWTNVIATPIDEDDVTSGYVSIQIDTTIQKHYLELMEEGQVDKDALFGMSPNAIVVIDNQNVISSVNNAFGLMFGDEARKFVGMKEAELDDFFQSKSHREGQYLGTSNLPTHPNLKAKEFLASSNNDKLTFEIIGDKTKVIGRSYVDCNQLRIRRIIYFADITERSIVEKMKSDFVATAAHELRTPLAIIFGYSELLKIIPPTDTKFQEMLSIISGQSKKMTALLNDILDMSRMEAKAVGIYQKELQSISPLLTSIVNTFVTLENHNLVALEIADDVPDIYIDAGKIDQVIKNCLSNAYKFSPDNGPIKIMVTKVDQFDVAEVLIIIQDSGIGMTPEQIVRVFERFYRANQSVKIPGTGLGMAIVKEIITNHNGTVDVISEYGVGTQVLIHLPVIAELS